MVLLHGVRGFPFHAPGLQRQRLHPSQKLSLGGLGSGRPDGGGFHSEGGEGLKAAEWVDLELEGPGISDLISSAKGRGGHSANSCAMTLSSGLRSGRSPKKHKNNAELEMPND